MNDYVSIYHIQLFFCLTYHATLLCLYVNHEFLSLVLNQWQLKCVSVGVYLCQLFVDIHPQCSAFGCLNLHLLGFVVASGFKFQCRGFGCNCLSRCSLHTGAAFIIRCCFYGELTSIFDRDTNFRRLT